MVRDPNGGACEMRPDNIGDWYKHAWPQIIHAPISDIPFDLMVDFFKSEIVKGNTTWPTKMLKLYNMSF